MLAIAAAIIVFVSLWYTNILVSQIAEEEKEKIRSWAVAIQKKAALVNFTQELFEKISNEERKRVEIWAEANRRVALAPIDEDPAFYTKILFSNTTIPMILTDDNDNIITSANLDSELSRDSLFLRKELEKMKSQNEPIEINYLGIKEYIYYRNSDLLNKLTYYPIALILICFFVNIEPIDNTS